MTPRPRGRSTQQLARHRRESPRLPLRVEVNTKLTSLRDVLSWVCAFALLTIPLVYAPSLHYVYPVPKMLLFRLSAAMCLALFAVMLHRGSGRPVVRWPTVLLGFLLVWMLLADLFGSWPASSFFGFAPQFEGWLGLMGYAVFYVAGEILEERQIRRLALALTVSGSLVGLLAIMDVTHMFHPWAQGVFGDRAVSTEGNPLFLGAFMAVALPVTAGLVLTRGSVRRRLLFGAAFLLELGGLYFSFGRGAWLGGAVGVVLVLALATKPALAGASKTKAAIVAALVVVVFIFGIVALEPTAARSGFERISSSFDLSHGSTATRLRMWGDAVQLIARRPVLGWGQDTYAAVSPSVRTPELIHLKDFVAYQDRPHNQLLYVAYAGGIPAGLLFAGFMVCALVFGFKAWAREQVAARRLFIAVALAMVLAHVVEVFFSYDLPDTAFPAYIALGYLARYSPLASVSLSSPAWRTAVDRLVRYVAPVACVTAAALFVVLSVRLTAADIAYVRGEEDSANAVQHFSRAVSVAPLDAAYALALGQAYETLAHTPASVGLAARTYIDAQRRMPWDPALQSVLGELYQRTGQLDLAEEVYRTRLSWDPLDELTLFNYAALLVQQQRGAQAVPLLRTYLEVVTHADAEAQYVLGLAYEQQGSRDKALAALREAQRIDPENSAITEAISRIGP